MDFLQLIDEAAALHLLDYSARIHEHLMHISGLGELIQTYCLDEMAFERELFALMKNGWFLSIPREWPAPVRNPAARRWLKQSFQLCYHFQNQHLYDEPEDAALYWKALVHPVMDRSLYGCPCIRPACYFRRIEDYGRCICGDPIPRSGGRGAWSRR